MMPLKSLTISSACLRLTLPPSRIAPIKSFHGENIVYVCDCKMDVIFAPFALSRNDVSDVATSIYEWQTNLIRYQITKNITHDLMLALSHSLACLLAPSHPQPARSNINFAMVLHNNFIPTPMLHAVMWSGEENLSGKQFYDILRFIF